MPTSLNVIVIEDSAADAELLIYKLKQSGFAPTWQRVETEQEFLASLSPSVELILADYSLPHYDALRALEYIKASALDIPFIIVSGTIGEECAVDAMRQGATDYLLKDRLSRLSSAVSNALEQRRLRQKQLHTALLLDNSERRQHVLLKYSSDGIGLLTADGTIRYTSPSTTQMLGYTLDELLGTSIFDLLHADDRQEFRAHLDTWQQHNSQASIQCRVRHRDGSWCWLEIIGNNQLDEPSVQALVINYRDISTRKHLEAQFHHAQKLESIGRLAGGIAHDFNNLLTAINSYAEFALEQTPAEVGTRADLEEIVKACWRATSLTRQLLTFARQQMIEPQLLDLNQLIADVDKLLRRLIGAHINLDLQLAPDLALIKADPGQIEQVLVNLAINARDAMPNGGVLTITTCNKVFEQDAIQQLGLPRGSYVALSIRDTGIGMDSETQQRIFEPFFTTKGPDKGTGLGLATCYGIIAQHGGTIWASSELHQGTAFHIYMPQANGNTGVMPQHEADEKLPRGSETILLAEDNRAVRQLAARTLRDQGYHVIEATDGVSALELANTHNGRAIDLLLTDMIMPHMNGKLLFEHIHTSYPNIKTLFVSGYDDGIMRQSYHEQGVAFLHKPFSPAMLVRKVREVLDAH
jgi:two-component system cell cycle sensor histidine kinase/response regulator CckA